MNDVSVIVPTFNRARMLEECIASLLAQTRPALEIIIVDDGSTDDTAAAVGRMPPVVRYLHQANAGKPAALNRALPQARGDWLWFFDDDDVALPTAIESRLRALERAPDAALVISRFLWGSNDADGRLVAGKALEWPAFDAEDFYPKFLRSCFAHLNGALVRRDRALAVGPFRTDLLTSEDYDFTLRVARGARVAICDEPTFIFRQHAGERGPAAQRYAAAERTRKFAEGDAAIGRWIRSSHRLPEFLGLPATVELDTAMTRAALLARLQVMAGKGLVEELAEDFVAYACALKGGALDPESAAVIKAAFQERYLVFHLCKEPAAALRALSGLGALSNGQGVLRLAARATAGAAWWQPLRPSERLRLAGLALRLALAVRA